LSEIFLSNLLDVDANSQFQIALYIGRKMQIKLLSWFLLSSDKRRSDAIFVRPYFSLGVSFLANRIKQLLIRGEMPSVYCSPNRESHLEGG